VSVTLKTIPRPKKRAIAQETHALLIQRQQTGPAEPGLDAFIPELGVVAVALDTHVTGRVLADATREAQLARAEEADVEVDTWFRHIESFLFIEANRRSGPNVALARGLYNAACPDGLAHIDDRIVDENLRCAETLVILKAPESAAALAAIKLPAAYIDAFEAALKESDAAIGEVIAARGDKSAHIDLGREAEASWVDLMVRLRRYIDSRAKRTDAARIAEGKALLKPLLDAVQMQKTIAAARATRRAKKGSGDTTAPADSPAPTMP
jgi:hypothetical protein